ncbi:MAG: hypothetical protein ACE5OS_07865 [Anaerolineae bacterium]
MRTHTSRHRKLLVPILALAGAIGFCGYGEIAVTSQDPLWFLGGASVPDPERIVIRVGGEETILTASSPGYDLIVEAAREALSEFNNLSPLSAGLSEATLAEYQRSGSILELYFNEPVDFHLPFYDGRPTALLVPIEGRHAGHGYVFRGRNGQWWAGQMCMSDPQPLFDALSTLGYVQQ